MKRLFNGQEEAAFNELKTVADAYGPPLIHGVGPWNVNKKSSDGKAF